MSFVINGKLGSSHYEPATVDKAVIGCLKIEARKLR